MKIDYKKLGNDILISLAIIFLFTIIDYLFHTLNKSFSVPERYFRNKIIYGTIYSILIMYFTSNKNTLKRALIFLSIIAVLLQVRYYLEGYPKGFVFLFLFIHFCILLLLSMQAFEYIKTKKINA